MRCAMRLMPLLLACLMLGQAVAARNLLNEWDPAKKQFLQIAVTYSGKCSDVDAARLLRDNAVADVKAYFVRKSKQSIADSVIGRLDTVCQDKKEGSSNLASFRTAVNWIGLDNTDDRQTLFRAANRNACTGGISPTTFAKLIAASNTADYSIKYNAAGVWNPNSKRGPIPYVDATNCNGTAPPPPASPAPASPAPASPAPVSPAPASPAPASPSPAPLNCSALIPNSVDDGTGKCVCTGAGFQLSALNGTTLAACLATSTATCPTAYPIPAKDTNGNIKLCQANINACPAEYPFFLVAGDSAAIVECRPAGTPCTISGFTVQIVASASGNVVGCVKNDGQCPSAYPVAYREFATSYQLQKCDDATSCPALVIPVPATPTRFTTSARTASGKLVGCFTLDYAKQTNNAPLPPTPGKAGTCPAIPAANFPINVVSADPDPALPGAVKTLSCLAPNSTCPSTNPIQLFAQTTAGAPPTVVTCALTSVLSSGNCPAAALPADYPVSGTYSVRIGPTDQVLGCSSSTDVCPVAFPFPTQSGSTITRCSPTGSTTSCTGGSIPAVDVAGNTVACLGAINACPDNYPIEVRAGNSVLLECRAQGASCPASGSTFPFYEAAALDQPAVVKQCRPKPATDSCVDGGFQVSIYTSDTLINANLVGCVSQAATTTMCPAAYPVAYQSVNIAGVATLVQCRPATITACPTGAAPTPATLQTFTTKVVDATNKIVACLALTAPACPPIYPVEVKAIPAGGSFGASAVVQCMPSGTLTCPPGFPFGLYDGASSPAVLKGCVPTQTAATCAGPTFSPYSGVGVFGPSGTGPLLGCTTPAPTACPTATIAFITIAPAIQSCRTSILTTCKAADPAFAVNGRNAAGAVTACIDSLTTVCPANYPIEVASTAATLTTPTDCLAQDAACPATAIDSTGATYNPTFPLYFGASQPGTVAKLDACVSVARAANGAPVSACLGNYASYEIPVYSNAAGTTLVGCLSGLFATGTTTTPCPSGTTPLIPAAGIAIKECRGGRTDCVFPTTPGASTAVYSTYKTQLKSAAGVLKGCQEQVVATACPLAATLGTILSEVYSFPLLGAPSSAPLNPVVAECRPLAVLPTSCAGTPYAANFPVSIAPVPGTLIACMANGLLCPAVGSYIAPTPTPAVGQQTSCA